MVGANAVNGVEKYAAQKDLYAGKTGKGESVYGKTVGDPKLSENAQKYYEKLKKKFGNYDFVLVSKSEMENVKANASKYANGLKTVVLIDEEKIEKMASDEKYREKYENILSGAGKQIEQLKAQMQSSGANVKGYGIQVNDDGTTSFFAVLKKSSDAQKVRIEKKAAQNREERRAEKKKAEKERAEERSQKGDKQIGKEETVSVSAGSIEELMAKIEEFTMNERSNNVRTESEMQLGQNIDFKG